MRFFLKGNLVEHFFTLMFLALQTFWLTSY